MSLRASSSGNYIRHVERRNEYMNKAYVEQIRNGLSTTALSMDTQ